MHILCDAGFANRFHIVAVPSERCFVAVSIFHAIQTACAMAQNSFIFKLSSAFGALFLTIINHHANLQFFILSTKLDIFLSSLCAHFSRSFLCQSSFSLARNENRD